MASPIDLEDLLREKMEDGYSARMTAGFCWRWSEARKDDTLVPDVQIGDWARPWNCKSDRRIGDALSADMKKCPLADMKMPMCGQ
jgi:uncharacterized protein